MNIPGYESLADVLRRAYEQAAVGKGQERHAQGEPFHRQVMQDGARRFGVGGLLFQAFKKSEESQRLQQDKAIAELLGAINYLAGAVIAIECKANTAGSVPTDTLVIPTGAMFRDPYTDAARDARDVASDPQGLAIAPPGPLRAAPRHGVEEEIGAQAAARVAAESALAEELEARAARLLPEAPTAAEDAEAANMDSIAFIYDKCADLFEQSPGRWIVTRRDGRQFEGATPEAAIDAARALAVGWIAWAGSERPVPRDTLVRVRFRTGQETTHYTSAGTWHWPHRGASGDIVAYKVKETERRG